MSLPTCTGAHLQDRGDAKNLSQNSFPEPKFEVVFFQNVKQRGQLNHNGVSYDPLFRNFAKSLYMTATIQKAKGR